MIHLLGAKAGYVAKPDEVAYIRDTYPDFLGKFPALESHLSQLSYTQWEAWLALYHGRDLFVWVNQPEIALGQPPFTREPSQQTHFELLQQRGQLWPSFSNVEQLRREILISLHDILPPRRTHRPCHLPYSSLGQLFIGRETFLAELHQKFEAARAAGHWPNHAVCGVGGQGKTQVAVEYATKYGHEYTAVLMINADTPESLRSGLAGLAGVLYADIDPATTDDIKERATLDWLQKNPGWLLIVDNADTEAARNAVIARLSQWANGHVLITARLKQWPQSVEALDLHVLSVEDGARFLVQATAGRRRVAPDDEAQARLMAGEDLDGLCLALEQAAAYIAEREISFAEYRHRWAENLKQVRTWADGTLMQYHPESEVSLSVATTWLTTFQQLPVASQTLLQMLSWLAPDPIPQGLIDHPELERQLQSVSGTALAAGSAGDRVGEPAASAVPLTNIEDALIPLRRYSLLAHRPGDPADSAGRVHRVMQLITRERLNAEEQKSTLTAMLTAVNDYRPGGTGNVNTWKTFLPLLPHLLVLIELSKEYDNPIPTTDLMGAVATYYSAIAKHGPAETLKKAALQIDEQQYGPHSTQVATRLNNLAQTLQATNRLAEAEPLMRRALAIDEQSYGADHPRVAIDLWCLAVLLWETERLSEAVPLMHRALGIYHRFSKQNHCEHPHGDNARGHYQRMLTASGMTAAQVAEALHAIEAE